MERDGAAMSSTLVLDRVGNVLLSFDSDGISWKPIESMSGTKTTIDRGREHNGLYELKPTSVQDSSASFCIGTALHLKTENEIAFSNIYAVELIGWGLILDFGCDGRLPLGKRSEMYRFVVHGYCRNKAHNSPWVLSAYTFGHENLQTCETLVEHINACISAETERPKSLLVFVHPLCGKGNGRKTWECIAPLFARAKVKTKVIITKRAAHAYDLIRSSTNKELHSLDGIVVVGGDGLFNEVLNGLLTTRYKDPHPPMSPEFYISGNNDKLQPCTDVSSSNCKASIDDPSDPETLSRTDDNEPLLSNSELNELGSPKTNDSISCNTDENIEFSFPNDRFRLGIIPAGSTDAVVICTTGIRDPVTSALQIILGKRVSLDVAQVVRWKTTTSSTELPSVRYAASFAGYGFYGDVIKESEKYRWMGPKRYDYVGTKTFLEHRSYEAEVSFLENKTVDQVNVKKMSSWRQPSQIFQKNPGKTICRMNCNICNEAASLHTDRGTVNPNIHSEDSRWLKTKGRFLSVGAAVISCRNEKAPDGLVADAHLADGFLHLILIKDCPRALYLWHLTRLTRRGSNPLNFKFVEHHKTRAFTFVANHDESAWNLDGELFQACQVTVRACRGLINLFASGPEF